MIPLLEGDLIAQRSLDDLLNDENSGWLPLMDGEVTALHQFSATLNSQYKVENAAVVSSIAKQGYLSPRDIRTIRKLYENTRKLNGFEEDAKNLYCILSQT